MAMKRKELKAEELKKILQDYRIILDCGHRASIGHNFSNTLIIYPDGKTACHNCGY